MIDKEFLNSLKEQGIFLQKHDFNNFLDNGERYYFNDQLHCRYFQDRKSITFYKKVKFSGRISFEIIKFEQLLELLPEDITAMLFFHIDIFKNL